MATYERLDYGSPDGCLIGGASTDKIGFYGTTPADQPASANEAAVSTTITTTLATNTVLETDLSATIVLVNQLRTDLVELGLIKGSA